MGRWRGAAVLLIVAMTGCTPSAGEPPPPSTSTPLPPRPTPTENSIERQERFDFAAAEKSYRAFRAEYRRVLAAGGAKDATAVMKQTAAGTYLAEYVPVVRAYREGGYRERGSEKVIYVRLVDHADARVVLDVCEDGRATSTYDSDNNLDGRGELRTARLDLRLVGGRWKIWQGDGQKVSTCS